MTGALPFAGLRVLDLGTFWAGPYLGCYLGALGADVVKVEGPQRVDGFRFLAAFPQQGDRWYELSGLFQATNLNKRDIALDLDRPEGRAVFEQLVDQADVLIENFSPRVIEQFGFGYEQLQARNPGIVMVRMPGFGIEGPWRDYVGFGNSFEYAGGVGAITGYPDGKPLGPGGYADPLVGMHAATAVTAALEARERTGRGTLIEVVQIEVVAAMAPEPVITHSITGETMGRTGNRSPDHAPQGVYPCADGEWLALTVGDDAAWTQLVELLGAPGWATDASLATVAGRQAAHDDLDAHLAAWTAANDVDALVKALQGAGIAAAQVLAPVRMYDDPQLDATGYYQVLAHPLSGERRYPTWPFRWGPERQRVRHVRRSPLLGEHVDEVLGAIGIDGAEIQRLREAGVVGDRIAALENEEVRRG